MNKKPTKLKLLQNTYQPCRGAKNEVEPDDAPESNAQDPPEYLPEIGKKYWKKMFPELKALGLMTVLDMEAFAMCCLNYAHIVECATYLKEYRNKDEKGKPIGEKGITSYLEGRSSQTNAIMAGLNRATNNYKGFLALFGLSPADRTKIDMPNPTDESGIDGYLNRGKG